MYLFDLDGTLIDSNGIWAEVDRTFLARRGYPYTKEYYEGVAHTIFPLAAVFTKEYCHLSESTDEIMAEWMELAKDNYAHVALKPHVRGDAAREDRHTLALCASIWKSFAHRASVWRSSRAASPRTAKRRSPSTT